MLTPADEVVRNSILAASDNVNAKAEEDILEPVGLVKGLKRCVYAEWSSPTVEVGKKYRITFLYMHPVTSRAWGALSDIDETIV